MKNKLLLLLVTFALATTAIAGETESSANAAAAPHNTAMFAVSVNPQPLHLGDGGAFDWSLAVFPTAPMPDGRLVVTAFINGTKLTLTDRDIQGGYVAYQYPSYWIESFFYGIDSQRGLTLVNGKLPPGVTVEVAFTPTPTPASKGFKPTTVTTSSLISDVSQSPDRLTVTFKAPVKTFNPAAPAFVYFTPIPMPVRPEAVSVTPDGSAVVLDLRQDPDGARWATYQFAMTIYQPEANGLPAVDQSALLNFLSPTDQDIQLTTGKKREKDSPGNPARAPANKPIRP